MKREYIETIFYLYDAKKLFLLDAHVLRNECRARLSPTLVYKKVNGELEVELPEYRPCDTTAMSLHARNLCDQVRNGMLDCNVDELWHIFNKLPDGVVNMFEFIDNDDWSTVEKYKEQIEFLYNFDHVPWLEGQDMTLGQARVIKDVNEYSEMVEQACNDRIEAGKIEAWLDGALYVIEHGTGEELKKVMTEKRKRYEELTKCEP